MFPVKNALMTMSLASLISPIDEAEASNEKEHSKRGGVAKLNMLSFYARCLLLFHSSVTIRIPFVHVFIRPLVQTLPCSPVHQ